jgi:hypothetical protein
MVRLRAANGNWAPCGHHTPFIFLTRGCGRRKAKWCPQENLLKALCFSFGKIAPPEIVRRLARSRRLVDRDLVTGQMISPSRNRAARVAGRVIVHAPEGDVQPSWARHVPGRRRGTRLWQSSTAATRSEAPMIRPSRPIPIPQCTAPYSATGDDQARRRSQSVTDDDQQRWDWRIHAGRADHECGPLLILGTVGTRSMS